MQNHYYTWHITLIEHTPDHMSTCITLTHLMAEALTGHSHQTLLFPVVQY